jgi:hypothetical protein
LKAAPIGCVAFQGIGGQIQQGVFPGWPGLRYNRAQAKYMKEQPPSPSSRRPFWNRENLWALLLCLVIILVFIMTADSSPLWIYQGF